MQPSPQTNAQLRARMEELLGEYEQLQRSMSTARVRMRKVSGIAATVDRTIRVQVDSNARLTGLEIDSEQFNDQACRGGAFTGHRHDEWAQDQRPAANLGKRWRSAGSPWSVESA